MYKRRERKRKENYKQEEEKSVFQVMSMCTFLPQAFIHNLNREARADPWFSFWHLLPQAKERLIRFLTLSTPQEKKVAERGLCWLSDEVCDNNSHLLWSGKGNQYLKEPKSWGVGSLWSEPVKLQFYSQGWGHKLWGPLAIKTAHEHSALPSLPACFWAQGEEKYPRRWIPGWLVESVCVTSVCCRSALSPSPAALTHSGSDAIPPLLCAGAAGESLPVLIDSLIVNFETCNGYLA